VVYWFYAWQLGLLLAQGATWFVPGPRSGAITPAILGIAAELLMVIGLWTPVRSLMAVISESWMLLVGSIVPQTRIPLLSISEAIAMLDRGSWSIIRVYTILLPVAVFCGIEANFYVLPLCS
jgi:hypothetical protein